MRIHFLVMMAIVAVARPLAAGDKVDVILQGHLARAGIQPLDPGPMPSVDRVLLGQMLYFDKLLSGNRDTACATCHHPSLFTGDALSLSIGTGATGGIGPFREKGADRNFVPRNAPEVFNRGAPEWTTMFWDARVEVSPAGKFLTPAGAVLPAGLTNALAAQAMFPVTGRDEMRGMAGDLDVNGDPNELAVIPNNDLPAMWTALMERLLAIPAYRDLFANAYPGVPMEQLGFQHAANAIGDFESAAFRFVDSPWDEYVAGDDGALTQAQKRGAVIYFGTGRCFKCHSGSLLTDQDFHNIAVPQLGPGKAPHQPFDLGRALVTDRKPDLFAFRTPPLRNVALTGPWMHNGAYTTLEGAVRHHLDPAEALLTYDASQLDPSLQGTVLDDSTTIAALLATLDPQAKKIDLSEAEIADLLAFLESFTSPSLSALESTIPATVPSGLPVDVLSP